jgi:hypothetical protein
VDEKMDRRKKDLKFCLFIIRYRYRYRYRGIDIDIDIDIDLCSACYYPVVDFCTEKVGTMEPAAVATVAACFSLSGHYSY